MNSPTVGLGGISFVNTLPIYFDLPLPEGVALHYDTPAQLNQKLLVGELQVSPVSSAFYLQHQEVLSLLPGLSVSSQGAVESVVFFSKTPLGPELLDQSLIPVPDSSATSVALLAHLLEERVGQDLSPWFWTYPAQEFYSVLEHFGCALVIGDEALAAIHQTNIPAFYHVYDLSKLWVKQEQLPFVFAVWAARKTFVEEHPELVSQLQQLLCQNRDRFMASEHIMAEGIEVAHQQCKIDSEVLHRYFTQSLDYGWSSNHEQALRRFHQILENQRHRAEGSLQPQSHLVLS